jgi:ribonucleotide reductase beta subunit family protein with ferritin-like domain
VWVSTSQLLLVEGMFHFRVPLGVGLLRAFVSPFFLLKKEARRRGACEVDTCVMGSKCTPPDECTEPLLKSEQRFTMYPIAHHDLWLMYKRQMACFWTAEEIDFSKDRDHWNNRLNDDERFFLKNVLAFFAASDSVVSLNLMDRFCAEVHVLEAQVAYTYQAMIENVHAEVYSIMIDTYIQDPSEKDALFRNLGGVASVKRKVAWAQKWASSTAPFARRLLAFAVVEGLFFSGAFCAIYWIKQRNLLPGLTKSNEFIARDEGQHTEFACLLYCKLEESRMSEQDVHSVFREAVAIEKEFIIESIPCRLVGMNAASMSQYIEYVADGILSRLGYSTIYGSANPFPFMELIGMSGRSNFFEERVSHYQRADVLNIDNGKDSVLYSDDF